MSLIENYQAADLLLKEWEKCIDVQKHFNDLILRNRQISLILIGGIFSIAVGFSETKEILSLTLLAFVPVIIALIVYIEFLYYRRLLLGAVKRTQEIDDMNFTINVDGTEQQLFKLTSRITDSVGDKPGNYRRSGFIHALYWFLFIISMVLMFKVFVQL